MFSGLVRSVIIGYSLPLPPPVPPLPPPLPHPFPPPLTSHISLSFSRDMPCVIFINSSLLTSDVMMVELCGTVRSDQCATISLLYSVSAVDQSDAQC